jgi:hypothetical protein
MIFQDLGDLEERLDFLMDTAKKLNDAGLETRSATESFKFFRDRNHLRQRWVSSFGDRTRLIINFVFSESNWQLRELLMSLLKKPNRITPQ